VQVVQMMPTDFRSVLQVLSELRPAEIYNLSGQSSVALSFAQPIETMESVSVATANILEVIRFLKLDARFYNACSSECFGDTEGEPASENTPFRPRSPYAVAKAAAFWLVANYRSAYGLYACSGILFNHESPLRPSRFVTRKIVSTAVRIARGSRERLNLGNISTVRDWGWAPEYVDAMCRMLQLESPRDFVIATGVSVSLEHFVDRAFSAVGLQWTEHVDLNQELYRPDDVSVSKGDPSLAERLLDWRAMLSWDQVVDRLVDAEMSASDFSQE
jgi:GDPmannose 4,6-dehydratase